MGDDRRSNAVIMELTDKLSKLIFAFGRMSILEGDIVRQREDFTEERRKLEAEIENKDALLTEQQEKFEDLKNKLSTLDQESVHPLKLTDANFSFLKDT